MTVSKYMDDELWPRRITAHKELYQSLPCKQTVY